jgi:hypothetical protein
VTDREAWLAAAVSGLAEVLKADFTMAAFSGRLADDLAELLDPADVAVVIADERGELRVEGATSSRAFALASVDVGNGQGPFTDSYRSGGQIRNTPLDGAGDYWPQFAPIARAAGFQIAHALPLRWREGAVGVAGVLGEAADPFNGYDAGLADALVTSAAIGLMQERALRRSTQKSEQLQRALDSRIVVEQAKGMVAARLNTDVDLAFVLLRDYARGRNERLATVCCAIVNRKLPVAALVADRRGGRANGDGVPAAPRRSDNRGRDNRVTPGPPPP